MVAKVFIVVYLFCIIEFSFRRNASLRVVHKNGQIAL
jgi:hypothetical protein